MASRASFRWDSNKLMTNIRNAGPRLDRAITAAVNYQATRSESYMRRNAKWTDRTGNARNGLHTATSHSKTQHTITLSHSVPYGIWLEVRWSGKYGIIPESVRVGGAELMALFNKLFSGLG